MGVIKKRGDKTVVAFQPFLRFWIDFENRRITWRILKVSTLLEILGQVEIIERSRGYLVFVSTLLEILAMEPNSTIISTDEMEFQPFLRFWGLCG